MWSTSILLAFVLASCWPATGPIEGVPAPAHDAWPDEPLAILTEHNPWALVIGADTPRVALFQDGSLIRIADHDNARARLVVSQLTPAELSRVKRALEPKGGFWSLKDRYNLMPNVTDQMTTELVVQSGKRFKQIEVYGYTPEPWKSPGMTTFSRDAQADRLPDEFARICKTLIALVPRHEVEWKPRYYEVILWPYEYSPDQPLLWPARWPGLTSPMAFKNGDMVSLILSGSEEPELRALVAKRGERQALSLGGKKWAISYRPVMPGGRWARDIAARQKNGS